MNETPNLHLWLLPLLPLVGALLNGLFGRGLSKRLVAAIALLFTALPLAQAAWIANGFRGLLDRGAVPHVETVAPWIAISGFRADVAFQLDQLSLVMLLVVTGVGFLIHVYSVGYMAEEGGYYRFFSYLNLFVFFMLTLVLANNFLTMFVGWEGVGLASYLLIGFYFHRTAAANAGRKAFIVNRVGDFGFLLAMFLLILHFGSLTFGDVFSRVAENYPLGGHSGTLTAIALLLLLGATGKSAQIPLYVWLPDAMEGPTPVSALIHAATMVTAGVYMIARSHVIFDRSPAALTVVAIVGTLTAFFAATVGLVQTDIKRVLAYSTISQLGYMFLACGVAAYSAAIFHLVTHAFFKALLFLAAGSVIHALDGEQDMRHMGGLRRALPVTFWTMTMATFAISGFFPFSGFFSKDEILWQAFSSGPGGWAYWIVGLVTAFLTSFYMFRLWYLTFFGRRRGPVHDFHQEPTAAAHAPGSTAAVAGHDSAEQPPKPHGAHESPWIMLGPLVVLAVLSVGGGWIGWPHALGGDNWFGGFLAPVFASGEAAAEHGAAHGGSAEMALMWISFAVAVLGLLLADLFYRRRPELPGRLATGMHGLYAALANKYYVDEGYRALIVAPLLEASRSVLFRGIDEGVIDNAALGAEEGAEGASTLVRRMQSGNIRSYAGWVALGAAAVIGWMLWWGVR